MSLISFIQDNLKMSLYTLLVESLTKGSILIPGETIRRELDKIVEEDGVKLKVCEFSSDGLHLLLQVEKRGLKLIIPLNIKLSRLAINGQEQKIEFSFDIERPVGENLLGKLATCIAKGIICQMVSDKITSNSLAVKSKFDPKHGKVVYDLSKLKQFHPLKKELPILNKKALDIIQINDFKHLPSGIEIKGNLKLDQ